MNFTCEQYPELIVHHIDDEGVAHVARFEGGVLKAEDEALIAHLSHVAEHGDGSIVAEAAKPKPRRQPKPKAEPKPEPAPEPEAPAADDDAEESDEDAASGDE